MLVTQTTEAQQKPFRSCPVFSAATLQWQTLMQSLFRNPLLNSATEFFMLRRSHPSSPANRTEISSPMPFQLVSLPLVIWEPWGILTVKYNPTKPAFHRMEEYLPGLNRQFCRGNLPSLYLRYKQDYLRYNWSFQCFSGETGVFQCYLLH